MRAATSSRESGTASSGAPSAAAAARDDRLGRTRPVAVHEAAVPAARPRAAAVGFQHDEACRRLTFVQGERRPEAGVAAADDADVGGLVSLQGWSELEVAGLVRPP